MIRNHRGHTAQTALLPHRSATKRKLHHPGSRCKACCAKAQPGGPKRTMFWMHTILWDVDVKARTWAAASRARLRHKRVQCEMWAASSGRIPFFRPRSSVTVLVRWGRGRSWFRSGQVAPRSQAGEPCVGHSPRRAQRTRVGSEVRGANAPAPLRPCAGAST